MFVFSASKKLFTATCGSPANVSFAVSTFMGINEGDIVTYTCNDGYAISGQSSNASFATCGSNGIWSVIPTCVGK